MFTPAKLKRAFQCEMLMRFATFYPFRIQCKCKISFTLKMFNEIISYFKNNL